MRSGNPATEDNHVGRRHTRHAAEQHATPAIVVFEAARAGLRRHAAGNLRHRCQQGKCALWARHGLIGNGCYAGGNQIFGLCAIRRKVEIGEQDLPAAKLLALGRQRLLDFHDHLGAGEHGVGVRDDFRADRLIIAIRQARTDTGAGLDDDLVPLGR